MSAAASSESRALRVVRRARPALGTLLEIGVEAGGGCDASCAMQAAFARVCAVESQLSRFAAGSDIRRFNDAPGGSNFDIRADSLAVLEASRALQQTSGNVFDVSLGTGPHAWCVDAEQRLHKRSDAVSIDLGGIGKGYAVDAAVQVLRHHGVRAGWVNAGGDLRVFGAIDVPIELRNESGGGVRRFGTIGEGAFATSRLGGRQVSVAADECMWADALTKLVAATGDASHPLLQRYGARAWLQ